MQRACDLRHGFRWKETDHRPDRCQRVGWIGRGAAAIPRHDRAIRRAALGRAGAWLGRLSPRLALEQEDAVRAVAERSGYSPAAVERAFRARYWRQAPHTEVTPERSAVVGLMPEL